MNNFIFRKIIRKIHLWIGLFTGLIIFIVCITGCIYAFQKEIKSVIYSHYLVVKPKENSQKLPLSVLLKDYGSTSEEKVLRIYDFTNPNSATWLLLRKDKNYYFSFLNPYTGELLNKKSLSSDFFVIVLQIHRNLLLGKIGTQIIGWSVVLFIISLITGIVLWFPKNRKVFKTKKGRKSKFTIKTKAKKNKVIFDLHSVLGFYGAAILLVLAITGIAWTFAWVDGALYRLVTFEKPTQEKPVKVSDIPFYTTALDSLKHQMDSQQKDRNLFLYLLPQKKTNPLKVNCYIDDGVFRNPIYFYANPSTGKIIKTESGKNRNAGQQLQRLYYDIHTGSIIGIWGKILVFLSGLIGASLPVTGVMMWLHHRKKKKTS